ncbi:N-acetyltransferase 6, partial [Stegodyphus mimosarum]
MKSGDYYVVLLHDHSEFLEECACLINKQWKRSLSARIQSLEKSYKDLPNSLLLIENINGTKKVIGHSRLSRVLEDPSGCWIGSVVIDVEKRNKGYGKYLMQKSEEYAK